MRYGRFIRTSSSLLAVVALGALACCARGARENCRARVFEVADGSHPHSVAREAPPTAVASIELPQSVVSRPAPGACTTPQATWMSGSRTVGTTATKAPPATVRPGRAAVITQPTCCAAGTGTESHRTAVQSPASPTLRATVTPPLVSVSTVRSPSSFGDFGGPVLRGSALVGIITRAAHPHPRIACGHLTRWAAIVASGAPTQTASHLTEDATRLEPPRRGKQFAPLRARVRVRRSKACPTPRRRSDYRPGPDRAPARSEPQGREGERVARDLSGTVRSRVCEFARSRFARVRANLLAGVNAFRGRHRRCGGAWCRAGALAPARHRCTIARPQDWRRFIADGAAALEPRPSG